LERRDGTVSLLRKHHSEVSVEELECNRGFAHACKRVIVGGTAPFVLLLNPDTVVHAGSLDELARALLGAPRVAVAGPRLVGEDGRPDHNAKRSFPTVSAAMLHLISLGRLRAAGYSRTDIDACGDGPVDAVSGSCVLVRRSAIAEVGLLDEGYWMYGEDLDRCRRFGERGWEIRYCGGATVTHVKHGTTGRRRPLRVNWAFHRAMGRFYRRFEAGRNPVLDVAVYGGVLIRFVVSAALNIVRPAGLR
jgi:N-acetylglucosaminyl-diphospho-decaprenol L-rhamnosyltransferase